jgi:ribose/xylose/arabinose/galactoside ABC-type transport system permease subunit
VEKVLKNDDLSITEKHNVKKGLKNTDYMDIIRKYGILLILLAIALFLSIISPVFLTFNNLLNVVRQISINGIIAVGMTFVIIIGGIDLSVGSIVAVAGVIAGSILSTNPSNVFYAVFAAIVASAIFGLLNGLLVSKFNIAAFVATLATMTIARGFALVYTNGKPYVLASKSFSTLGQGYLGAIPVPVVILVIVVAIMSIMLNFTKFGRYVYALGGNENATKVSGINVSRVKTWVFVVNGALAGLAGVILASRINSGQPAIGTGFELDAIAAVVIGGTSLTGGVGTISGTIIGSLIIGIINNGLNLLNVSSYYQQIVKGLIIAIAVIVDMRSKKS